MRAGTPLARDTRTTYQRRAWSPLSARYPRALGQVERRTHPRRAIVSGMLRSYLPARKTPHNRPTACGRGTRVDCRDKALVTIEQHAHTHAAYVALSCLPYATLAAPHPPTHTLALRCSGQGIQRSRNHGGRTGGTAARDRAGQEHIRHQTLRSWEVARGCTPLSSRVSSTALGF